MEKIWEQIVNWLTANASEIADDILSGVTQEEITELEKYMQVKFPEDFKQSYLIHNGQQGYVDPLMGEWELLSLEHIKSEWDVMKKLYDEGEFADSVLQLKFNVLCL